MEPLSEMLCHVVGREVLGSDLRGGDIVKRNGRLELVEFVREHAAALSDGPAENVGRPMVRLYFLRGGDAIVTRDAKLFRADFTNYPPADEPLPPAVPAL